MRLFLGILLLCASVLIAWMMTQKSKKKTELFDDLLSFHNAVASAATIYRKSILQIIEETTCSRDFAEILKSFELQLAGGGEINLCSKLVSERENKEISAYFRQICVIDGSQKAEFIKNAAETFHEWKKSANDAYLRCKKTYIKLGFLFGCILMIIVL